MAEFKHEEVWRDIMQEDEDVDYPLIGHDMDDEGIDVNELGDMENHAVGNEVIVGGD